MNKLSMSARQWLTSGLGIAAVGLSLRFVHDVVARRHWHWFVETGRHGTALVTGASSGIGMKFAEILAAQGHDLVLVARREDRLLLLAKQLELDHHISVDVLPADLTKAEDLERVASRIELLDDLELLVNNAGFGATEPFAESDLARQIDMIELHVIASTRLMRAALPGMVARRHGGIINVSSTASFFALPNNANYSATKAFLTVFSRALHLELRNTGVRVQALCPGLTRTGYGEPVTARKQPYFPSFLYMSAEEVVRQSLDALARDKVVFVPGLGYKLAALLGRSGVISDAAALLLS
jgi:uncharacterized protein